MFPTRRITTSGGNVFRDEFSLAFDGSNDYLALGDVSAIDSLSAITISSWIKCSSTGGTNPILSKHKDDNESIQLLVNGNKILFQVENSNDCSANFAYTSNDWNHIVAVFNGSGSSNADKCKIYLNGVSQTLTFSGTFPSSVDDLSGYDTYIGRRSSGYYIGNIDEVAIWNAALDADAITAIYNSGTPTNLNSDSGDYDNSSNLQGYWRMGDGTLDEYPLIADQTNATLGADPLTNGNFDTGDFTGWTAGGSTTSEVVSHDGHSTAAHITTSITDTGWNQNVLTSGKIYKVSFDVKVISGSMYLGKSNNRLGGVNYTDSSWTSYTHYWKAGDTYFRFYSEIASSEFYIDNISVELVNGSAGFMTNMVSGDIEEDTP